MSFPQDIDQVPSIDANKTLGQEQHTQLHLQTFDRIRQTQSYIGGPPAGGEPDIPTAGATIRERLVSLEAATKNPSPILSFAVNSLAAGSTPSVNWDANTGKVTLGIPVGAQGPKGDPGQSGTPIRSGRIVATDYAANSASSITVPFPPPAYASIPKVMASPVQVTAGPDLRPLLVGVRNVTLVGFTLVVENLSDTLVRAEINWIAL